MAIENSARANTRKLKGSLFNINMTAASTASDIKIAMYEMKEGKYSGLDVLLCAARTLRIDMPRFWEQIAALFDEAVPTVDWSKPSYVIDGEDRYESFEDFYSRECENWIGPFDHFKTVVSKYLSGDMDSAQATEALQASANVKRGAPAGNQNAAKDSENNCEICTTDSSQSSRAKQNGVSRRTQIKLDRLAKDRPDLLAKVKFGELSVNAAAMEAGIVKAPSRVDRAITAFRQLSDDERQVFLQQISRLWA